MKLTKDKVIDICLKIVLPICILFHIALWKVDSSTIIILMFIVCNIMRYKVTGYLTRIDLALTIIITVVNVLNVAMLLVER